MVGYAPSCTVGKSYAERSGVARPAGPCELFREETDMQRVLDPRRFRWAMMLSFSIACAGGGGGGGGGEPFGKTDRGEPVSVYTLKNAHGMTLRVMDYSGIVLSLLVPDRSGRFEDVVLGYDSLAGYLRSSPYFGALIGRYGNRIAHGRFTLDGQTYTLAQNNGPNHLHGGVRGFDKVVWAVTPFEHPDSVGLVLRYTSPDGEEGYPGTLRTTVTYTLTSRDELIFDYFATTNRATPVNLTQHSDSTLIPTGELKSVAGTPFDFRTPTAIGARIDQNDVQLRYGPGYDHNFVLNKSGDGHEPTFAARVYEPGSGRVMEIYTTEPGLQ